MYKLKSSHIKFIILIVVLLSAFVAGFFVIQDLGQRQSTETETESAKDAKESEGAEDTKDVKDAEAEVEIKSSINLDVPFTSQAPYAVWDELHNEDCEEAAVIMANQYLKSDYRNLIPAKEADQKIKDMVNWQIQKLGTHKDLTATETTKYLAEQYLGFSRAQVKDFSVEGIKKELSAGKPVIVPSAGRLLNNPNFKRPGPVYHMVVIVGYVGDHFITNDPGTRRGYKYKYTYDLIQYAAHDWAGKETNIETGKKVYIVLN